MSSTAVPRSSGPQSDAGSSALRNAARNDEHISVRIASEPAAREKAYALGYRVYHSAGSLPENSRQLYICTYDCLAETQTLLAEDPQGRVLGTLTLVFDSLLNMPCHERHATEVEALRKQGCRLLECTRLAVDEEVTQPQRVLEKLISLAYLLVTERNLATDLLLECARPHIKFYQRIIPVCKTISRKRRNSALLKINISEMQPLKISSAAADCLYNGAGAAPILRKN
jgi:hypothetical protein